MNKRITGCPVCGYKLIARKDDEIICLSPSCNWRIFSKRGEDKELPDFEELRRIYNE